jgi:molybdate transport system substrate-binding protein
MKSLSGAFDSLALRLWMVFCAMTFIGLGSAKPAEITVFAAASLTDALKEISRNYGAVSSNRVVFNFGASSMLARQIEEGAPADIFFSADEAKMDLLAKKNLLLPNSRTSLLSNSLVIVTLPENASKIATPSDLASAPVERIALADPKAVPAGIYAKAFLEQQKLWPKVAQKIIPTDNVRAALAAVESGNVDAGIVFRTDAVISRKVQIAFNVPAADNPQISYPAAVIKDSKQVEAAKQFLQYLRSNDAAKIFETFGFIPLR